VGWRLLPSDKEKLDPPKLYLGFLVDLQRADEVPMTDVLKRPLSAEVDDYRAYKIISTEQRERAKHHRLSAQVSSFAVAPLATPNVDGTNETTLLLGSAQRSILMAHPGQAWIPDVDVPGEIVSEDDIVDEVVRTQHAYALHRLSFSIWLVDV
jgi:hypothetical protein